MVLESLFSQVRVLVRGGGDLGSGVIYRLHRAGFSVIVTELARPLCVRRTVCFGMAALEGTVVLEGLTARRTDSPDCVTSVLQVGEIPVIVDEDDEARKQLLPHILVDARMKKSAEGLERSQAPLVVALGPGHEAGGDCHAVIETNRGHSLGRVLWQGMAEPDTHVPGEIGGAAEKRVLYAPCDGFLKPHFQIGERVTAGDVVGSVDGQVIVAQVSGLLRGLIHPSVPVCRGVKIGDIDPRAVTKYCFTISDKSLAVAGGVVEAILSSEVFRHLVMA